MGQNNWAYVQCGNVSKEMYRLETMEKQAFNCCQA
jgi:hypothetical protein